MDEIEALRRNKDIFFKDDEFHAIGKEKDFDYPGYCRIRKGVYQMG